MNNNTKKTQEKLPTPVSEKLAVTVRLEPEALDRLDAVRGNRSRQYMLSGAVDAIINGLIDVPENKPSAVLVCN